MNVYTLMLLFSNILLNGIVLVSNMSNAKTHYFRDPAMTTQTDSAPTKRKQIRSADAQARILEAVDELFYQEGSRTVSVDEVVLHAGVNKMSLYRQFESKDALLMYYLQGREKTFWGYFETSIAKHPGQPVRQMQQFFDDLAVRICRPGYRGCAFVNMAVEYPDRSAPPRQFVAHNKSEVYARFLALATAAGARQPEVLASGLALLTEGAYAASQTYEPGHPSLAHLPATAATLIAAAGCQ